MSNTDSYRLQQFIGLTQHYPVFMPLVRDEADDVWWQQERQLQVSMQVRSGDYFATLATKLDGLSQQIKRTDEETAYDLELLVNDLLYLQRNYAIDKKSH
jgi:hypothetical protein